MKKKLVLFTFEEEAKRGYQKQLKDFFGDRIEIEAYALLHDQIEGFMTGDLYLITVPDVFVNARKHIPQHAQIMYITRTFEVEKLKQLDDISKDDGIIVFDYSKEFAEETIAVLREVGYKNLDYYVGYPGKRDKIGIKDKTILTIGNYYNLPKHAKKIINIGWYCIASITYIEIANLLKLHDEGFDRKIFEYSKMVKTNTEGVLNVIKRIQGIRNQWDAILDMLDDGIIITNALDQPVYCNDTLIGILGETSGHQGSNWARIRTWYLEFLSVTMRNKSNIQNQIVDLPSFGKTIVISKRPVFAFEELEGYLVIVKDVTKLQNIDHIVRKRETQKGFRSKYTFDDIIANSNIMQECIQRSKKIARTEMTVLITGESGVGKELLAQSIHNYSNRHNMPFVAINCAALPAELLESELFGYEEGAFTGSKKGGKPGLFELAHRGTVLLDEIGELPLLLQSKLLRVLQEKEVMRVGAGSVVPIEVRVIATSNVDFSILIEEKKFRKDLYYRLNMMRIHVPSLKNRKKDIRALVEHFFTSQGKPNKKIEEELIIALEKMPWSGNVRELMNCINYMFILGGDVLTLEDLPDEYKETEIKEEIFNEETEKISQYFLPSEQGIAIRIIELLNIQTIGRRKLTEILQEEGYKVTEQQTRRMLQTIKEKSN